MYMYLNIFLSKINIYEYEYVFEIEIKNLSYLKYE